MHANLIMRECVCLAFDATQKKTLIGGEKTCACALVKRRELFLFVKFVRSEKLT